MTALRSAPPRSERDFLIESLTEEYLRLEDERRSIEARQADLLGEIDATAAYEDEGFLSPTALVRELTGVSDGAASRRVADARGIRRHPEIAAALTAGDIDLPRARLLFDAAAVSEHLFRDAAPMLIQNVARLGMKDAGRAMAYWKQAADMEAAEADAEHLHRRRRLHVSQTLGGMVRIDGELDPDGGQVVLTALHSLTDAGNLDDSDIRSPAQRRADALVDLCADHLDHGDAPVSGQTRPHVSVIVSTHALEGHTTDPSEYEDGVVITPNTARRVACDSTVTRIVMGPDSMPLDVGRATRTIPPAIRTALVARDRHCQWTGCGRPSRWCDAHHLEHWADGGPTSLDNLVLLCRRHHRMTHHDEPIPQRE